MFSRLQPPWGRGSVLACPFYFFLSPLVRRLVEEHGVDSTKIAGTGMGGRVTRSDVEKYVRDHPSTTEPFNGIRRATARHMVGSKAVSPHVLTAMEVDFENVEGAISVFEEDPKLGHPKAGSMRRAPLF